MKQTSTARIWKRLGTALSAAAFSLLLLSVTGWSADSTTPALSMEETLRLGEKMYREGLLPSGEPVQATIRGDVKVPGTAFSCVSCHLRSGIGSVEGQILSPPTTGLKLYQSYYLYPPVFDPKAGRVKKGMWDGPQVKPIFRPPYTDETLAEALMGGVDPLGREFNSAMPRYELDDRDMKILITYIKNLSAEPSPGVDREYREMRFATVIAGNVPADQRTEMLATLEAVMAQHNRDAQKKNRYQKVGSEHRPAPFNFPRFVLSRWELKGAPDTWRAQLEEHYRREPVFALLGGLSSADWKPMHEFSEQHKIPCLLPITDLPVISDTDWYTLYFNRGVYLEGETVARYLAASSDPIEDGAVLQVVEDTPRSRTVAAGFLAAWKEAGRGAPETVYLQSGQRISTELLKKLTGLKRPAALLLWTADGTLATLDALAALPERSMRVFVSSGLLHDFRAIPEKARGFTYISYPYRLDKEDATFVSTARYWLQKYKIPDGGKRISTRLFSLNKVLLDPFRIVKQDFNPRGLGEGRVIMESQFETLMHVKRNYYRDYLFDVIGMFADTGSLDYERLSFGPGQRYMSKGCYIVQISAGEKPQLLKKSDWVLF